MYFPSQPRMGSIMKGPVGGKTTAVVVQSTTDVAFLGKRPRSLSDSLKPFERFAMDVQEVFFAVGSPVFGRCSTGPNFQRDSAHARY